MMSFGPACERCGANSYEGSMDERPIICPWCKKPKRRGSRQECVDLLQKADHVILNALGYIRGASIMNEEQITRTLVDLHKEIADS